MVFERVRDLDDLNRQFEEEVRKIEEGNSYYTLDELVFLYFERAKDLYRSTEIPWKEYRRYLENNLREIIPEYFEREKIRGVGCGGNYPENEHDFLTPISWRREDFEGQQEYEEYFESD